MGLFSIMWSFSILAFLLRTNFAQIQLSTTLSDVKQSTLGNELLKMYCPKCVVVTNDRTYSINISLMVGDNIVNAPKLFRFEVRCISCDIEEIFLNLSNKTESKMFELEFNETMVNQSVFITWKFEYSTGYDLQFTAVDSLDNLTIFNESVSKVRFYPFGNNIAIKFENTVFSSLL